MKKSRSSNPFRQKKIPKHEQIRLMALEITSLKTLVIKFDALIVKMSQEILSSKAQLETCKENYKNARAHAEIHAEAEVNKLKTELQTAKEEAWYAAREYLYTDREGRNKASFRFQTFADWLTSWEYREKK